MRLSRLSSELSWLKMILPVPPVSDPPTEPSISLSPAFPVYLAGEMVTIECVLPNGKSPAQFRLQKDSISIVDDATNRRSLRYTIQNLTSSSQGLYTCSYKTMVSGLWVTSSPSQSVPIVLTSESQLRLGL
ncbi:hypothetical protein chiPu_0023340 [Chiloscyllium punctatum]|uniref:Ig-like domain-containing protein n=1 Tax=Chiloscyllium punctatum TaxID=137246 RepID=A0A401T8L3_CHIPU|nr:hypothetical protein [Chiloscyllium punctatum]